MTITGISTSSMMIVQTLADLRTRLDDLQRQLGTGEKSIDYAGLGAQRALAVGLQAQLDAAGGFADTITLVQTRLSLAQTSLTGIYQSTQSVKHALVQQSFILGQGGQTIDQQSALGQLDMILAALNTQDGTGYIFSGLSPDRPAVETLDHILSGSGVLAGFKQVMSERRQADLGASGLGRLVIPAAGSSPASIIGSGATILPDAAATIAGGQVLAGSGLANTGTLVINGINIALVAGDLPSNVAPPGVIQKINAAMAGTVTASLDATNHLVLTGANADTAIVIGAGSSGPVLAELGLSAGTTNPTNLLTQFPGLATQTLIVTVGANPALTVTFGNGGPNVSTLAELTTALAGLAGGTATVNPANGNINIVASSVPDTITIGGTASPATFGLQAVSAGPALGTRVSLSEDVAGSPFGFKLAGVSSTLTGANVIGPTGAPAAVSVDFQSNPAPGGALTLTFTLPDGTTEKLTLTATAANPPGTNQFTIGASPAATAANLRTALTAAVTKLADTSLVAASAVAAANNFFDIDAANPPLRVNGPPFDTATSLIAGTAANTVTWYTGEAGTSTARSTGVARVDPAMTISYGMRANEQALRTAVKNVAVFAATTFSSANPNASAQYGALTSCLAINLVPAPGSQSISDIQTDIANAQIMAADAQDRHRQSSATLSDFLQSIENVSPEQVGAELLALQMALQASLQTTALLSRLSLVNYL